MAFHSMVPTAATTANHRAVPEAIRANKPPNKVRFDRDGVAFLREALARPQPPASGQRSAVRVHLDGSVHISQRLHLEGLVIDAAIAGGAVDGRVTGTLGGTVKAVRDMSRVLRER